MWLPPTGLPLVGKVDRLRPGGRVDDILISLISAGHPGDRSGNFSGREEYNLPTPLGRPSVLSELNLVANVH